MHVVQRVPRQAQRRMYLASERQVVNGVGLGELEGMFNFGKMFTRMFKFTKSSFQLKNIAGAIGSAAMTIGTGGIANVASEIAGPSGLKLTKGTVTGAHSKVSKIVGYGTMAAAAVVGAVYGGAALLPAVGGVGGAATGVGTAAATGGGFLSTAGSVLSTVGSGLMTAMKALPMIGGLMGRGGGQQQQQGGMTQAEYDAMQAQAQQQAAYDAQVRAQQVQMYTPGGYAPSIPYTQDQYAGAGQPSMTGMNASYGDLRTPYTGVTQDGEQIQVNPQTGQVIQAGIIPDLAPTTWLMIGGATLAGWYLMSGNKSTN